VAQLKSKGGEVPLPIECGLRKGLSASAPGDHQERKRHRPDDLILDVGPRRRPGHELLKQAGTIVWNGTVGVFDYDQLPAARAQLRRPIVRLAAFSVAGGGETVAALAKFGVTDKIGYVSTAGGAFLEFLEGKKLPAWPFSKARRAK
jgi:phosphoglycerate kinase